MKIVAPKPFTFKGGKRAVLLLHGFTGTTADVRMLGRFLQNEGYTCHAPLYRGHGVPPEELVQYSPEDWWEDVEAAYEHLQSEGYDEIAVCGLSLGGVFTLKLGFSKPVKGIVSMCAPVRPRTEEAIKEGFLKYAKEYKQLEKKTEEEIDKDVRALKETSMNTLYQLRGLMDDVRKELDLIYAPALIVQARHDEMIDIESANMIYKEIETDDKEIKWYEKSTHVITLGDEKETLHQDILSFLNELEWSN
ncbi:MULTISPECIES: alpha/beta hydrolase [Shouchella]|uniref:Carboxylesterase n=2 Tax=Shouchella TaxID=2893057 RepID=A0ABY7W998_9BACI|nr:MULTISPECIES: carboxylesterase [Shouchella]MED4129092.1 carboxylesterase [Shouchella miscanthi]WDF04392.1 carboxylesterase [Shouchella hunanensis]GAF21703.1 carboxylesterase [Bacillus sp. JCM 19047]